MSEDRVNMIRRLLKEHLAVEAVEVEDDSARHAGHPGARGGGGHFNVLVVSPAFAGQSRLRRHRMVYDAMGDAMKTEIHALSIRALTPEEYQP